MKGRQAAVVLTAVVVLTTIIIMPSSLSRINGSHAPDGGYIKVTGRLFPEPQVGYKFKVDNDVPRDYKADARGALASWQTAFANYAPTGDWTFVRGEVKGVTDMVIRLSYDESNTSYFCTKKAGIEPSEEADMLAFLPIIASAYAEPMDSPRRSSTWIIYVGCGDQLFSHSNIQRQVAHAIGHALGMGITRGTTSIMCHPKDADNNRCEVSQVPTSIDVRCVIRLYGEQGFVGPNAHTRPEFCT